MKDPENGHRVPLAVLLLFFVVHELMLHTPLFEGHISQTHWQDIVLLCICKRHRDYEKCKCESVCESQMVIIALNTINQENQPGWLCGCYLAFICNQHVKSG